MRLGKEVWKVLKIGMEEKVKGEKKRNCRKWKAKNVTEHNRREM